MPPKEPKLPPGWQWSLAPQATTLAMQGVRMIFVRQERPGQPSLTCAATVGADDTVQNARRVLAAKVWAYHYEQKG